MNKRLPVLAAVVLLAVVTYAIADTCTTADYLACQNACASATPPTCSLAYAGCSGAVTPTCSCDYVCSISPRGGNGARHIELALSDGGDDTSHP